MAIHYRLVKNTFKGNKDYGKYFAHTVKQGEISMEEIERTIEKNCSAKISDIRMVLYELFDTIRDKLQAGYTVNLNELGKLSIAVKSVCVDNPEEFKNNKHITGFKCKYTPYGKRMKSHEEDCARRIERSLFDGCKSKMDK